MSHRRRSPCCADEAWRFLAAEGASLAHHDEVVLEPARALIAELEARIILVYNAGFDKGRSAKPLIHDEPPDNHSPLPSPQNDPQKEGETPNVVALPRHRDSRTLAKPLIPDEPLSRARKP